MTDTTIAELRELLTAERSALRAMKESGAPNDALLDAWLKASGRLNQASIAALPALLDRVEAGEAALQAVRSFRKRYEKGARNLDLGRKERTRCSHYVQVLDEIAALTPANKEPSHE